MEAELRRQLGRGKSVLLLGPGRPARRPCSPGSRLVVERAGALVPVETKWTDTPTARDVRHVELFLREYPEAARGALVCRTPRRMKLADRITALPWQEVSWILDAGR